MASVRREIVVAAPADAVWEAIRDVGAVHTRLARRFVVDTRVDGDSRLVTFANGMTVRERIVTVDDEARRLVYAVVEWQLTHHNASFQVVPETARSCRVIWITDLLPDSLADLIIGFIDQGCEAIKQTLEDADRREEG
jgi:hypothetical protein